MDNTVGEWQRPKWLPRGLKCRVVHIPTVGRFLTRHAFKRPDHADHRVQAGKLNQWINGHRQRGAGGDAK